MSPALRRLRAAPPLGRRGSRGPGGGTPRSTVRPEIEADEEDERDPDLDDLVEPGPGDTVRGDRKKDQRLTSRPYTPLASLPTAMVTFQLPASSASIATL